MSISLKGHTLNQRQLDVIAPVMNDLLQGRIGQDEVEDACLAALESAGCPVGYDTTMPGSDKTIQERAMAWAVDGQVGMSSKAIYSKMLGLSNDDGYSHPWDPSDLNRCLLLLDLIPEWKPRIKEMAECGPFWAALVGRWDELVDCFIEEAGFDWCKAKRAPKTYALMRGILGR